MLTVDEGFNTEVQKNDSIYSNSKSTHDKQNIKCILYGPSPPPALSIFPTFTKTKPTKTTEMKRNE